MKFAYDYEEFVKKLKIKPLVLIMLSLPHIVSVVILTILFPNYWLGILLLGWIIPDYAMMEHYFIKKEKIDETIKRKKIAEIITFVASIFLVIMGHWEVSIAGFLHLIFDYIGF